METKWLNYGFGVYLPNATWNPIPGIYIFCFVNPQKNVWEPLYIGETESFKDRFANHDRWDEACRLGATHVHAMAVQQAGARLLIEKELIQRFQPVLNVQHK